MVELEQSIIPTLSNKIKFWKRYIGDTFCFAKAESIVEILLALNRFCKNEKFTVGEEQDSTIPFLDVLMIRKLGRITMMVQRKKVFTDLFMK